VARFARRDLLEGRDMTFSAKVTLMFLAASFAGHSAWAAPGLVIVQKTTVNGVAETHQIQITPQRMRTEVTGPNGPTTVVFDGAKQVLIMINTPRKSYSELTKAEADQMGAQLSGAMAQMQEALKNLPPEQRAQMEAMMKGRGLPAGLGAQARPQYKKGGTQKVGKWTCDVYEISVNNQKTGEICTVSPQTLGFTAADFEISRKLADFVRSILPQGAEAIFQVGGTDVGFSGVPVRSMTTVFGRETITEMTDVSRQDVADALFAVPPGFTKEAFGGGLGIGRGAGRGAPPR
jgi:hypothetical protein